ncbi:hypothetical protein ACWGNF_25675 [Streptomyces sp. NPDC055808]
MPTADAIGIRCRFGTGDGAIGGICFIYENRAPVPAPVASAYAIRGLDPMYVANEGTLALVPWVHAEAVLRATRAPWSAGPAAVSSRATFLPAPFS